MGQKLLNRATGQYDLVEDADIPTAISSGKYVTPDAVAVERNSQNTYATPEILHREGEQGLTHTIDPSVIAIERGHKIREDRNSGIVGGAKAFLGGAASGLSFGTVNPWQEAQEFHSGLATTGEIAGAVAPAFVGDDANLLALLARDGAELETASSAISSKFLFSGELGAEGGSAARATERGLAKSGAALEEAKAIPAELGHLDSVGLKAERESELARIDAAKASRRQSLVDDLGAHASAMKNDEKIYLATKGIKEAELPEGLGRGAMKIQEIGAIAVEPDRQVMKLLRNPKLLMEEPKRALGPLMQQENALEQLAKREPTLREIFAADTTGARAAALDRVPVALERNRQLQSTIRELIATPQSERLSAIDSASELLKMGKTRGLAENVLGGSIMGHVAGAFSGMPIIGPMIGAKVGQLATDLVFGRLGKAMASSGERAGAAISKFLNVAKTAAGTPQGMVLATKTLSRLAFGPRESTDGDQSLVGLYRARTKEIKKQTMYAPDGSVQMRPEARQAMASKLSVIRAVSPIVADKLESLAAKRLAFLSSKIPRRPDIDGIPMGPDHWQPSELEMRGFARYAAAVEDPHGVIERLAHGTITPEDAEVMKAVYPELMARVQQQIAEQLPALRKSLPYSRRVALSIFSGVPVDPAMKPQIFAVLQGSFENEPGSDGGTQQPTASPAFGSVKKSAPNPTPAQSRSQGA